MILRRILYQSRLPFTFEGERSLRGSGNIPSGRVDKDVLDGNVSKFPSYAYEGTWFNKEPAIPVSIPDMDDKVIATVNYLNIYQPQKYSQY